MLNYSLDELLNLNILPEYELLSDLLKSVIDVLENEKTDYRPLASSGETGALIELQKNLPVLIIPDIHARPDFINNILDFEIPLDYVNEKLTVYEALQKGQVYVVCVGDAIHNELKGKRWKAIQKEFNQNVYTGKNMQDEMIQSLSALTSVMKLKIEFPEYFHFLKGNHENILNQNGEGDFAFCKYAEEGFMVKQFISDYYGDDILYFISLYEKSLPLIASSINCVISHAEPADFYSKEALINARENSKIIEGLTWTKNEQVTKETVLYILKNLLDKNQLKNAFYFTGHRPVQDNYALRQNGKLIQIHNPYLQNIVIVSKNKIFNPDEDIMGV